MLWWLAVAFAADSDPDVRCPDHATTALVQAAEGVEEAWLTLDGPGFDVARNRLARLTGCADEVLSVEQAVTVHRARALTAFVDGDAEASRRSFAALHALDPSWTPDPDRIPQEHPLWRAFRSAVDADEDPKVFSLKLVPEHGWAVDGTRFPREGASPETDHGLPGDRAFVLQTFAEAGDVAYTGYHLTTADLPIDRIALLPDKADIRRRRRKQARLWGTVIGSSLLAAGGVTFGLGWAERTEITSGRASPLDVDQVQARANTLGAVGYGLAGSGAALVAVAWSVPW